MRSFLVVSPRPYIHCLHTKQAAISDDTWYYFVSWLIMQGKELFYAGLETPDSVFHLIEQATASMPRPRSLPQAETTEYIARETYTAKTRKDLNTDAIRIN